MPRWRPQARWLGPMLLATAVITVVAAGASAAIETNTVGSFGRGIWWSISLITTVGFIGEPPETTAGAILSIFLMIAGFFLLAMVSASLAAIFVREEEEPRGAREEVSLQAIMTALAALDERLQSVEQRLVAAQDGRAGPAVDDRPETG